MSADTFANADPSHPTVGVDTHHKSARRSVALARWRRRSRTVRFYRRVLPWSMAALVLFGVGWVLVRSVITRVRPDQSVATIHLLHPIFYGRSDRGESYVLSAEEAVRDGGEPDRIAMTLPRMKQFTDAPEPQTVTALRGLFHEKTRKLDLYGQVRASDGQGNHFASEVAHVDMPRNFVSGQSAVSGYGPSGTFSASSYAIYDKGKHLVFMGDVHAHLVQAPATHAGPLASAR